MGRKFKSLTDFRSLALLVLLAITAPAHAEWRRAETGNFVVYADTSAEIISAYARHLERFDALLRHFTELNPEPPEVKFTIYLVSNMGRLQRHMGGRGYISGIYLPDMRGPYAVAPLLGYDIVFHEYVHDFMLHNAPAIYPTWYSEGFAEFFSSASFDEEGHARIGRFPLGRADDLDYSRRYPFRYMLADTGDTNPLAMYVQGWLVVHHSIFHAQTRQLLEEYLNLINRGQSSEQAYRATFATHGDDLEDEFKNYGRGAMPTSTTTQTFQVAGDITVTELSREEADVQLLYPRLSDYLEREVTAAARNYPRNPQAQAELAQLRLAQDRLSDAIAAADLALAVDPDHAEANTFKGTALLRYAASRSDPADFRWGEARALFLRANHTDPYYPLALLRYYQSFPNPAERPENALAALEQAFRFVPQNFETRLQLAIEFLRAGRFEEARLLAGPMAQSPHSSDNLTTAARTIVERSRSQNPTTTIEGLSLSSFLDEN